MRWSATDWFRGCRLAGLWCCMAVVAGAPPARAQSDAGERVAPLVDRLADRLLPRCLTPAVGQVLQDLVAAGKLQALLSNEFTLMSGNVGADQIELKIQDPAQHLYAIALALPGSKSGQPDGQGRNFLYFVEAPGSPPNPRATQVLLAIASLLDAAIPDTAIERCAGTGEAHDGGGPSESHADRRYPRALALASAVVQVLIIAAAIAFGLYAIRPRSGGDGGGS